MENSSSSSKALLPASGSPSPWFICRMLSKVTL
ncbi:hypothetical protein WN66_05561 [Saccharomyces cerevisiae]|uniref:Putative uncharacterized protein YNR003W-A n=2 Tax=Saccharomyces cerevisiae TaxID=4932 RepID=YN003_YEAST|nr:RecName: Full=Putative uncharacterized protein YNR003W-A [Saccharomyces cerevisiae S288C]AAL79288.1 unknown [Saccharomyces cerevisiae]KZV08631.1 hypothetical protein WN66_05561 [Saccharomyces cerevisiae]CAY82196.1 EC1118_1N18_0430p [Saccharomyces cerevisiae EC1118]